MPELGTYNTTVAVCFSDLSPDDTDLAGFLVSLGNSLFLGSVDKCHTLAEVEFCLLPLVNPVKSDQ